ncbi:stalk domain-containing protein [Paenibacillus sp. UMB7766-LJ446]|uniref:choice-of-anchor I domain-containing protein n=1 Tax=Paenibacillus sp. UMB7766-LJ446 TaxID=3046313 RepID=UPI00254EB780|nr:stalk domain-containing protein [Paenibacillus sp. UMB7766-LJ446]MDK8191876.1 stalk domain-containing protein [Paenibacillus sp. UMB7766-LJ446]
MKKRNQWLAVLSMTAILTAGATSYTSMVSAANASGPVNDHVILRTAIENMQGTVTWDGKRRSVDIQVGSTKVQIPVGTSSATINGVNTSLDSKSYITKGTTYVSPKTIKLITDQLILEQNKTGFERTASFQMPGGKAEISASTPDGQRLLVTEADNGSISVVDIADLNNIHVLRTISFHELSAKAEVTSVTVSKDGKYGLAVIRTGDTDTEASQGLLAVVDLTTYKTVKTYELGIGPDSIALSPDGLHAVIAIEDEEINKAADEIDYANAKRPGSIMIVSFAGGNVLEGEITNLPVSLDHVAGVSYPHDPQPEYVAISPDSKTAAITLQENNAIAIVDLQTKQITSIFALGTTSHLADLKDDGVVKFTEKLTARYEPDGIAFSADGKYLLTANEGDLGKNEFDDGVKAGGRNIAVWDLQGKRLYDSQNLIDEATAQVGLYPDDRSPNKGSEVENLTVATIKGKTYAAVASERADAILFFDLADPVNPAYLGLIPTAGESPEGIHRVHGRDLFVSADESTGTLSFFAKK